MDIVSAAERMRKREISPVELLDQALAQLNARNPELNAVLTVCEDAARAAAERAESDMARGAYRGPLHGIPVVVKDLIDTRGVRTTMGSKRFANFVPSQDAAVVERLRAAGAVLVGKAHTHEFAYGPTGDRSYFGPARNPRNPRKMTGGSSSGSAAAVASGMCLAAIGTDTGGSIRIPSAACGVVGLKPTYGRVSKRGVFPLSDALDHVGPITQTVRDNAVLLNALACADPGDPRTFSTDEDFAGGLDTPLVGTVIGVLGEYFQDALHPDVETAFTRSLKVFEQLGARLEPVSFPHLDDVLAAQTAIQQSEAYAVHAEWVESAGDDYDPEVYQRLLDSREARGYAYVLALRSRPERTAAVDALFDQVDVLVSPTLPIPAPDVGQREVSFGGRTYAVRDLLLRFTRPFNYTGNPALSLPIGTCADGLPVGLQIIGRSKRETDVYRFGHALQQALAEQARDARRS
ncbi:MAG: amidase [Alicyclobacillus sp.]|nr:amidase [Alicyclobacillus sp.]